MVRKTLLSVTALALVAMSAHTTFAAETAASPYGNRPQEIRLDDAYTLPSVFVDKLSAGVRGGTVEGEFTVLSEVNDVIGNLQYRIEIYGDLPGQPTNDPQILFAVSKTFDIAPLVSGERRVMKYSYALPSLPEGTFTARIQVLHGGTRELGWANARISVPATAGTFLTTYGESIALPEFEGKGVGALTGPNVDPESDFSVTLGVFNAGGPETVVVPRFTVHRMDLSAPSVSETGFDPLAIPSTDSTITLQVKAPKAPGVYVGALTLEQNGKTVSTIGQYRFVVRGLDADIISARLANVASLKGETAFVRIDMVGPADAETTGKAFMQVSIRDSEGIAGQVTVSDLTLNDGVGMGMAKVTLSRDLASSPDIFVVIKDAEGNVLAESTTSIGLTTTQLETQSNVSVSKLWAAWYLSPAVVFSVFFGLLCVLALLVVLRKIISLRKIPVALQHAFSGTMIVILITTQFSPVFAHGGNNGLEVAAPRTLAENLPFQSGDPAAYTTYWSQVWNRPIVALFVNRPIHNSTVDCRQPIPLEFRVEYAACNNIPAAGRVIARFDANGNHQTTLMGTNANWVKVFEDTYIQVPDCGGARACIHTKNYNTNVNLNALANTATKTTLQVVVKHNAYVDAGHGVPDDTISTNDVYFQRRFAQAFNLHLNCAAVCGNTVVETGEQCDDGNNNQNDACNNQCQRTRCGDNIIQRPNGNGQQEECDDGNTTNNDGCSNICELETADIEITKTSNKQNIQQNETFTYNLLVKNNGPTQARDVVVTDTIPAVLTITSLPATCTANGNAVTCNLGDLSSGATRSLNIGIRAPASGTCPLTINNRAVVTTTSRDTNNQNNASTATIDMACVPTDVTITKTAPASFVNDAANTFNYTITAINNTAASALNVVVTDPIPAGLTVNSAPGCTIAGQNLTCAVGTLAANATRQFTVSVTAAARTVCAQSRTNTATVSTSTPETNPNNNQASATTSFTCTPLQTDIRIVKTAPATINNDTAGTFNYVLAVTNLTATPATNVVVTDAIPNPINISALPGGCSQNGGTVQCNLGTLAGNATVTITIPVSIAARAACGQSIPNTATVQTSTPDTNNGNNQSTASTNFTCTPPTDIEVVKTAPATLNNDTASNFNYVITLRNLTTSAAQNVSLSDNIPPSLTITSVPAGCSANGNAINCPVGVLAANATRSFTIGVSAAARSVCSQTVTNTASATTSTIETNQNNNQSSAQTAFTCTPQTDIRISKTAPATLSNDAASPFTYTIAVANTTSTPAANVVITDAIPSTLSITSLPAGCSANGNAVTCSVGTLAGNATRQYVIGVSAAARTVCSQTVTNTANVTTTTQDTNSQNNQASAQTNFTCTPITDIEITKSAPATVSNDAASPFNYTLTVRNLTANAAANVVVTDNIHGALVITSVPAGCSANGNAVTCSIGTLAANATRTIVIGVSAAARTVCSQAILNTTSVTTTTPESSTQNNQSSAQTAFTCTPQTDVTITKTAPVTLSNDAVAPFNYTLTARNNTTVSAANVVVTDTIPQPLTVTSVPAGCSANGNTVTCNVGTLAGNATRQYVIGVSAAARAVCAQTVTNTAFISTTTQETNANNNQASAQTSFTCTTPQTDVRIVKTAPTALTNNAASPFNYTLTVTNLTANAAANVIVTDTIPAQLTVTSLPAGCARTGNAVTCTVGTLAGNASREFVIGVSAAANTVCNLTLTNTANVTTTTPENNTANNQSSAQTHFTCPSQQTDVTITKTAPATLSNDALSSFNYTITATNTTAVSAASVIVTDAIPAPLTITALPAGCTANGNAVTCTVGTLAGNQSRQFVIGVSAAARTVCAQTVTNTAYVTTTTPETNPGNNQASVQTNFTCTAQQTDVTITKTAPATLSNDAASTFNYTLTVTNTTAVSAANVVITDTIPAALTVTSLPAGCARTGNAVTCTVGTLAGNQSRQYVIGVSAAIRTVCAQTVTNTAQVTTTTPESNTANNQASAQTNFTCTTQQTDISIDKTGPSIINVVDLITYRLSVTNNGPARADTIVIRDVIPAGLVFQPDVSESICHQVGNAIECPLDFLSANQTRGVTVRFRAGPTFVCGGAIHNTATVTTVTPETNLANNQSSLDTQVPCPSLSIEKTAPATSTAGGNITYSFRLRNTSTTQTAQNVVATDWFFDTTGRIVPPFTFVSSSLGAACSYVPADFAVSCNFGTLNPGQEVNYTLTFSIPNTPQICNQTVMNQVDAWPGSDRNNAAWDKAQTVVQCPAADVTITKTAPATLSNDAVSNFNYTISAINTSTVAADNVVISDTIPQPLTITSLPAGCSANGNTVTCNVGTLAANTSRQYLIGVSAAARAVCSQTVTNYTYITTSTQETNLNNNQASAQTAFTCTQQTDISITKTAPASLSNDTASAFNYTLTVQNNTSVAADNVVITDAIPGTLTVTSVPAGCSANGNTVTCNVGTLAGNQSRQYVIGVSAAARAVCSQTITNTASVTTSTFDTNSQNNQSFAQTVFTCTQTPRLYITKAGPATVTAGSMITYTFTLQNTSAFTATNVNVYDYFIDQNAQKLLPAPFTFVSSNGLTCQYDTADQRVECNPIDLAANQTISFTMTFSVPNTQAICNQVVTNKAETIAGTNQQTLDTDTVATTVQCPPPQFTIVKNGPASVTPGELLTYIITATNTGPTAQNNIQFVDDVPAGLTFEPNGSTIGCFETAGKIYCPAQTFQPGQTVSYTLKFRANQNIACNSSIYNEAKLAFNGTPFITSNRTQTTVQCTPPKLDITKSAPPTINIGGTITYSFSLRNTSATQTATEVELYDFNINAQGDPLMPYFTFQSISLGSCDPLDSQGRIHCNLPNLAPNQVVNFTMTFAVPNNQNLCGITVINQVDVWTQRDIANTDWDKAMTTVQCAPTDADVSIVKSGPVSVNRGSNITYSLVVSNAGPATATNVVTRDQIPAGLTFVSASGASCSQVNGSIDCTIGSLAVGAPQTILLTFSTQAPGQSCTPGSVQNVATVTATTTDTNMANNQSQVFTSLTCPQNLTADVSVVKTGPATVVRGNQIAYSIIVSNSGPSTATGINMTDIVPSGFTYVGATGATCAVTGNQSQVSCNIGTLNSGASANIVLTFSVPAMPQNCTQSIATNTVSVTSATTDPNLGNNSSSAVTTVTCPQDLSADIAVMKFGPSTIVRGNQITYSLVVTNYGPGAAQGVTLSDPIPQGLTFVSSSGGQCSVVGSTLTCTIGTLPSGQSSPIITATFLAPTIQACAPSSVTNTATITATTQDPQLGNNSASAITAITCPAADTADLSIVKTGTVTAQYGAQVTYSLNVTNNGPSSVDNVTVSDTFPAGLTYVSVTGATCQLALPANSPTIGGILSCDVGTLASGAQKNIQFVFSTAVPAQCSQATVINNATVSEADPNVTDSNSTNNQSSASTTLTCPNTSTDLSITKTGQSTVVRGSSSTYTIVVTNNGPSTATNVVMTDTFSSEYTYSSASGATCNVNGSVLTCTIGTMTSGQSVTITAIFTAKTQSNTCSTATVTNTASVASDTTETNTGNNTSSVVTTQLTCPTADISVYKTDNRSTANVLDRLRYSIIITNNSSTAATNLLVTDNVPYDLTILTVSDGGTVSSQQVRWTDISVPANSSRTLYIDAEVKSGVANGTVVRNTVDVNGKSATDDTTIYNNTTVNPPYYPPYNPPVYQPPYNPPVYYPPVQNPPVYYPPVQNPPQVIYPQTGDNAVDLYAAKIDTASVTQVTPVATQDDNGFSAVFYATLIALLAVGSAAATRFVSFGL